MQRKKMQSLYTITLEFPNHTTRTVKVRASNLETAERRALKRNPAATNVKKTP